MAQGVQENASPLLGRQASLVFCHGCLRPYSQKSRIPVVMLVLPSKLNSASMSHITETLNDLLSPSKRGLHVAAVPDMGVAIEWA